MGRHSTRAARSCRSGGLGGGQKPNMGFMVDHLMNYGDSAREGQPVYSLGGGKGYVWIARFGARGREGALSLLGRGPANETRLPGDAAHVVSGCERRGRRAGDGRHGKGWRRLRGSGEAQRRDNPAGSVDSGAADVSLPPDVVSTLIRSGTITEQDFLGQQTYTLADGSRIPSPKFRIKSIMVGNRTIYNVDAALAPNVEASILLGQSFLGRLQSWSIDNDRHVLILK